MIVIGLASTNDEDGIVQSFLGFPHLLLGKCECRIKFLASLRDTTHNDAIVVLASLALLHLLLNIVVPGKYLRSLSRTNNNKFSQDRTAVQLQGDSGAVTRGKRRVHDYLLLGLYTSSRKDSSADQPPGVRMLS